MHGKYIIHQKHFILQLNILCAFFTTCRALKFDTNYIKFEVFIVTTEKVNISIDTKKITQVDNNVLPLKIFDLKCED